MKKIIALTLAICPLVALIFWERSSPNDKTPSAMMLIIDAEEIVSDSVTISTMDADTLPSYDVCNIAGTNFDNPEECRETIN